MTDKYLMSKYEIPFTQYLRPKGQRVTVTIEVPKEVYDEAMRVVMLGGRFECEHLTTGHASLTVAYEGDDVAIEVVMNGPAVPPAVHRLVHKAVKAILEKQNAGARRSDDD